MQSGLAMVKFRTAITLVVGLATTSSCEKHDYPAQSDPASYATQEPGSHVTPTHQFSVDLLLAVGPTRLRTLQRFILNEGHQCKLVTGAILAGGVGGTDEWRVSCADSGLWSVWLSEDHTPEVVHCDTSKCDAL